MLFYNNAMKQPQPRKKVHNLLRFSIIVLLAFAMVLNVYLSWYINDQKLQNEQALKEQPTDKCFIDANDGGCFTVQTSIYAKTLGIANPLYGLFFFTILSLLFIGQTKAYISPLFARFWNKAQPLTIPTIAIIMTAGSIFSMWLLYAQYILLQTTCIYCLWVDSIMILATIIFFIVYNAQLQQSLYKPLVKIITK